MGLAAGGGWAQAELLPWGVGGRAREMWAPRMGGPLLSPRTHFLPVVTACHMDVCLARTGICRISFMRQIS